MAESYQTVSSYLLFYYSCVTCILRPKWSFIVLSKYCMATHPSTHSYFLWHSSYRSHVTLLVSKSFILIFLLWWGISHGINHFTLLFIILYYFYKLHFYPGRPNLYIWIFCMYTLQSYLPKARGNPSNGSVSFSFC